MDTEINKEGVEDTQTSEELLAKIKELEGYNTKLQGKLKDFKDTVVEEPKEEEPKETPQEDTYSPDVYEIAELSKTLSREEIKLAEQLVGTPFGATVTEVSNSVGFKATLEAKKAEKESAEMMNLENLDFKPIETQVSQLEAIPHKQVKSAEDKALVVELMKKQIRGKSKRKL